MKADFLAVEESGVIKKTQLVQIEATQEAEEIQDE